MGERVKPEAALQRDVVELARRLGILVAHFQAAQIRDGVWMTPISADGKGFPDLVLVSPHRVAYAELKDRYGKLSEAQERWLERLRGAGEDVFVWRPADWESGMIEAALRYICEPRRCAYCGEPTERGALVCVAHEAIADLEP